MKMTTDLIRCDWVPLHKPHYVKYHDEEWGVPVHEDQKLFEMLSLEGAQAGLTWDTILKKRDGYRSAFHRFDAVMCARMTDSELEGLMHNEGIVRNRLKIFSVRKNAQVFLGIQKEFGSFSHYLWQFTEGKPLINKWESLLHVPASTPLSDSISQDLKKRGMTFVGSTIIYAFLQAVGIVNDHLRSCWCSTDAELRKAV